MVVKPITKFEAQTKLWANMRMELALNVIAFNVYIAPLLEYVAQLLIVDVGGHGTMQKAMRVLASGPGNWIELRDLENLSAYGFPASLRTSNGCQTEDSDDSRERCAAEMQRTRISTT